MPLAVPGSGRWPCGHIELITVSVHLRYRSARLRVFHYRCTKTCGDSEAGQPHSGELSPGGHCWMSHQEARALGSETPGFKSYLCSVTLGKLPNLSESCSLISKMGKASPEPMRKQGQVQGQEHNAAGTVPGTLLSHVLILPAPSPGAALRVGSRGSAAPRSSATPMPSTPPLPAEHQSSVSRPNLSPELGAPGHLHQHVLQAPHTQPNVPAPPRLSV